MPKQEGQKSKLLALLRIFEQQTDENHLLNVPQLVEMLARQGILCERKSVYSDIEALNALGYDIQLKRGRHGGYWMASRTFDLAELKLLVDAVQSSRVISKSTSDKLIKKAGGPHLPLRGQPAPAPGLCRWPPQERQQGAALQCGRPVLGHQQGPDGTVPLQKSRPPRDAHHQSLADGLGKRLLLPHCLSG